MTLYPPNVGGSIPDLAPDDALRSEGDSQDSESWVAMKIELAPYPSDLSVVRFTEFGEKFCKAVIGDVSGLYAPPDWARDLKPKSPSIRGTR